ncbi:nuclear transport factor 2 family protein [Glutamicibacter sp. NPDC087344]|uniref:nuclear transport factor 2 family protein n=1 Tax=Glutamicibacter sp. NPDC087344 TaxID=3363994 RepID=UPI0038176A94
MSTPTIPEPIASFIARVNEHNEQAFLDAFTATGKVDDWGRIFTGRDAIKRWSDAEFIGAHGVLSVEQVIADHEQITVVGDWRSTHANGRSRFTFDLAGDKISVMTIREG